LLQQVEAGFGNRGDLYNACKFRAALGEANGTSTAGAVVPIKEGSGGGGDDCVRHARACRVVDNLKTILSSTLPLGALTPPSGSPAARVPGYEEQSLATQQVASTGRRRVARGNDHRSQQDIGTWSKSELPRP